MKNTHKIIISLVIIAVIILIVIHGSTKKAPISIGAVLPQSGFGAYWGIPDLKGIQLAEKDLKKKYGEERVSLFIEDGQSAVAPSVSAAQKLLGVDKVNAIYTEFSGPGSAISPVAKAEGKILVYSTYNQKIAETNEYSIKTFTNFEQACDMFAKYVHDSTKKVLIISTIGDVAPYCERTLLKTFPKDNVKMIDGFVGTDFRTVLLQNKAFAPDFIIPIMYEDGSFALIKQKTELGFKTNIFGDKQDSMTAKILSTLPTSYTDGIIYFETPLDENFVTRMKAIYPEITPDDLQAAANGYQSIMALGEALAECPNGDAACATSKLANKGPLTYPGYKNGSITNRTLQSDITIGVIKDGKAVAQ